MWSCVRTHRHKTVTSWITNDCNLTRDLCTARCSLTRCPQEPSIHRASFTHFTLVLESIHSCQGRQHSRAERRVETSTVRSTPTHKPAHQSQYSVHDSLTPPTSQNKWYHVKFDCVSKGDNTHGLNVESRRQTYGPHPHTNQDIKVSTLYTTHSSNSSKQMVSCQVRLSFKSGFGVVSLCGHVSRHTDTKPSPLNHKQL
jgi:hypothetical protein